MINVKDDAQALNLDLHTQKKERYEYGSLRMSYISA